jgi:hypothetical protein
MHGINGLNNNGRPIAKQQRSYTKKNRRLSLNVPTTLAALVLIVDGVLSAANQHEKSQDCKIDKGANVVSATKAFFVGDDIVVISHQYARDYYRRRKVAKVHKQYFVDCDGDKWNLNGWRRGADQWDTARVEHWSEKYKGVFERQQELNLRHTLEEQIKAHLSRVPVHSSVLKKVLDILNAKEEPTP